VNIKVKYILFLYMFFLISINQLYIGNFNMIFSICMYHFHIQASIPYQSAECLLSNFDKHH